MPTTGSKSRAAALAVLPLCRRRSRRYIYTRQFAAIHTSSIMSSSMIPWGRDPFYDDPFSSLGVWDPIDEIGGRRLGGLLWDKRGRDRGKDDTMAMAHAHVDWRETNDAHIFTADLPGVRREELKVEVENGNVLQISGERTREEEDEGDTWHRVERRRGSFLRRFRLPENAEMDQVKCGLDHGVLTVTVPKKETEPAAKRGRNVRAIDIA